MTSNARRNRNIVSIKRTIWSNYDKFRTLGVFYLEKNAVLDKIVSMSDDEIAKIADECREGGVRWRNFVKYLNKIEAEILGEREIIDLTQLDDKALEAVDGKNGNLDEFEMVERLAAVTGKSCPEQLANLRDKAVRFDGCCSKDSMDGVVFDMLGI